MTPIPLGFSWLARLEGGFFFNHPDGATFTMEDGNIPSFLVHLDRQVRTLRLAVDTGFCARMVMLMNT
jgi:minor extracellular serine protease Vpr